MTKPKYPIRNKYTSGIFQNTTMRIDLVNYCEKNNIILDFSNTETWSYQFGFSEFTRVGVIDTRSGTGGLINVFNGASRLVTIDKLILKDTGGNAFTNTFNNCSKLENITIEGVIGKNISFAQSPLTKESIISIITHLSSTSSGQALSLKASSTNAIDWSNTIINGITYNTFDEICDLRPNWTISLV